MKAKFLTPKFTDMDKLLEVEKLAWSSPGQNIEASREKIEKRLESFGEGITLALVNGQPAGSQYSFRFSWNGNKTILTSWDAFTAKGWTNRVHRSTGNTGFLVGVGVVPEFRGQLVDHNLRWSGKYKVSILLVARTLDILFDQGVRQVIGNARVPCYHQKPGLTIDEYCQLRRDDGKLFDPVLLFHESLGAKILKPVPYAMDDAESLNAGCWVIYNHRFNG